MWSFKKKQQETAKGQGTAIWIDEFGAIRPRVFNITGEKEDRIKIDFGNDETYIIPKRNLRARRCMIYKLSDGKIRVQNPDKWKDIDLKKYGIKELRFNLQNFALQEGRAAIHRWTIPPDKITKLSSLFKLLMICVVIGVIGWAAMKFGAHVLDVVSASRILECSQVLPKAQVPLGAITEPIGAAVSNITNATAPIGT